MWLLQEEVALQLQRAEKAGLVPTAQQRAEFEATVEARDNGPRNMRVAGATAEIRVEGVLTKKPDIFAMWFGGGNTTYTDIQAALAMAASDPAIKDVSMYFDSPGGNVDGLFDTIAAIENFRATSGKPIKVRASNAQSAAYGLAAAAGKIEATSPGATFGSVGTAVSYLVDDQIVTLTNTDSPEKRPDLTTEEGKAVVVRFLDAVNELFVDAIARGRGVEAEQVKDRFGRGSTLLAGEAKKRGMIDAVAKPVIRAVTGTQAEAPSAPVLAAETNVPPATGGAHQETKKMTLEELRAQHPEHCKALVAEGVKQGEASERDRVCAHLTLGEASGDLKTAFSAIKGGEAMTATLQAQYMAAGMNKSDREQRQSETEAAAQAVDNVATDAPEAKDLGDVVADALAAKRGKKVA